MPGPGASHYSRLFFGLLAGLLFAACTAMPGLEDSTGATPPDETRSGVETIVEVTPTITPPPVDAMPSPIATTTQLMLVAIPVPTPTAVLTQPISARRASPAPASGRPVLVGQTLTGTGNQMASQFWLDEGILILSASYDGRGNLVTQLIDEQARTVGRLNIGRGATELKQIVRVPHPGNYVLDVRAIGSWSITIEPGEGPSIPTPFAPKALTGTGTALTDRFELEQRPYVFRITWRGSRSFRMSLVQEDGRSSSTIATGKGSGQISKTVRVPRPGRYLFDVRGDGDWSVSVELLSD